MANKKPMIIAHQLVMYSNYAAQHCTLWISVNELIMQLFAFKKALFVFACLLLI